jgi:hypothetical protein
MSTKKHDLPVALPVNMSLSKLTKNRGKFPSDEALLKFFYFALRNIRQKWTMPIRDWKVALTHLTILFEERLLRCERNPVYTKYRTHPCDQHAELVFQSSYEGVWSLTSRRNHSTRRLKRCMATDRVCRTPLLRKESKT